jgi:hypothetical protein
MSAFKLSVPPHTISFELDLAPLGNRTAQVNFYATPCDDCTRRNPRHDEVEFMEIMVNGKDIREIVEVSWPDQWKKLEDYIECGTWAIDDED